MGKQVKLILKSTVGIEGVLRKAGATVDVSEDLAAELVQRGKAELYSEAKKQPTK